MPPPRPLVVATDGSALHNPGWGGWAWVAEDGTYGSAGHRKATNNHMELRAVLEALRTIDPARPLVIQTDSQYVRDIFTKWLSVWQRNGMRRRNGEPVLNADLIGRIAEARAARAPVTFEWVRGHAGHPLNEQANDLAQAAARHAMTVVTGHTTGVRDSVVHLEPTSSRWESPSRAGRRRR
jgi:ribonuclease HI